MRKIIAALLFMVSLPAGIHAAADNQAPNTPVFLYSSHTTGVVSSNNNFSIILLLEDAGPAGIAGVSYVISKDAAAYVDGSVDAPGPGIDVNKVENGTLYFLARAIDADGNSSGVFSYQFMVDYRGSILEENGVKVAPTICKDTMRVLYSLTSPADSVKIEIKTMAGRNIKSVEGPAVSGANTVIIPISGVPTQSVLVKVTAKRPDGKYEETYTKAVIRN